MTNCLILAALMLAPGLPPTPAGAAETPAPDPPLPEGVRAMIEAAIASGDAKAIETVIGLARKTNPQASAEIDSIDGAYRTGLAEKQAREAREQQDRLAASGLLDNWTGQIELGASRSSGNSDNLGLYAAINLQREGINWRHKLVARADRQETNDVTTMKRVLASWQPQYKFDHRLYTYGLAQYEYDPFLGYYGRYTAGGGIGYGVVAGSTVKLDFEGGPAFRYTDPVIGGTQSTLAGRASLNFSWKITPTLELKQSGAFYHESGSSSANASTALDTRLLGALKARLSYNVQYESNAPAGAKSVDTQSRATLVYGF